MYVVAAARAGTRRAGEGREWRVACVCGVEPLRKIHESDLERLEIFKLASLGELREAEARKRRIGPARGGHIHGGLAH